MPLSVVMIDVIYSLDYRHHHHHHYFKIRLQLSDNSGIQKPNDKDFLNIVSPSPPLWVWFSFNGFVPWNSESTFFFTISPFWPLNAEDIVFLIENTHGDSWRQNTSAGFSTWLEYQFLDPRALGRDLVNTAWSSWPVQPNPNCSLGSSHVCHVTLGAYFCNLISAFATVAAWFYL